jgi:hypothetical protein
MNRRRCSRCNWIGSLDATRLRLEPGAPIAIHVCPSCGSTKLVVETVPPGKTAHPNAILQAAMTRLLGVRP